MCDGIRSRPIVGRPIAVYVFNNVELELEYIHLKLVFKLFTQNVK